MVRHDLDMFKIMDTQAKKYETQEKNEAPPEPKINARLIELFEQTGNFLNSETWAVIKDQTRTVELETISAANWKKIRCLCALDGYIEKDRSLLGFYLSLDGSCLFVYDYKSDLNAILAHCGKNLVFLRLERPPKGSLDLVPMKQLRHLHVGNGVVSYRWILSGTGLEQLSALKTLRLFDVWFSRLDVSRMTALETLHIDGFECLEEITGLESLPHLKRLQIWNANRMREIDISGLENLEVLELARMSCICGLSVLQWSARLKKLHLCSISSLRSVNLTGMKMLEEVSFSGCKSLAHIEGLDTLDHLTRFGIDGTSIHRIPDALRSKPMKNLDLSELKLEELPDWLPELGLPFTTRYVGDGIHVRKTVVNDVDISIFDQPQEVILQWFAERKRGTTVPLSEVKVVFLGDGEAGKTHTIARLLGDGEKPTAEAFDGKATPGIVIQNKEYELDGKKIQVHFWDFGGQEILHSMHRMFLTERTLYVVIINARDDTQDDRARYWLHNIKSFAGSAPVLLVLNKIDQNPNASIDTPNLQKMYGGLKEVVRMSALEDSREQFNSTFTEALLRQVRELGTLGTLWPRSWLKLKTGLETMETNYIHGVDYEELCESCGVEQNREELLHWFNDLGVSFCYEGSDKLEDYVILKPEWLTNAIYIILFNKCPDTENGIIPLKAINRMLRAPRKGETDEIRRVLKDVFYDPIETDYVMDVIRRFRLSYEVRKDAEFIPVLCQRESMAVAEEYEDDPDALEFRMDYDYLPDNVIHRLMVEMRQDLDTRHVWRTGARFAQQGTGLSAVVRSEGNALRIFVRSESTGHLPNTYLHILKGNIDRIVADMKLKAPYCEVIYKAEGITEEFDYDDLISAQHDGDTTYRSKKLHRRIPIQDILNQSGRTAEVELDKLRAAIITACMQLQGNSKFWDATEDQLNTYVRDTLRNKGYLVYDQTFQGIGAGEKSAGELDLDIRQKPDIPWTIYEALKIRDTGKTQWNAHLAKLLDNYNPSGLNYLFLVTYVDCGKDAFQDIWENFSEHIRWHNAGVYERLPNTFSPISLDLHNNPNYIRAVRCTYDRAGSPTTVCHFFVRMGR